MRVLYSTLFVSVLLYDSETMIWSEKKRSRIWAILMNDLRSLIGIRRIDIVPNIQIRELCRVIKEMDDRIDEGVTGSSDILKERGIIGLLKGYMWESV